MFYPEGLLVRKILIIILLFAYIIRIYLENLKLSIRSYDVTISFVVKNVTEAKKWNYTA